MRIAQVAPLAESVPPKLYGGTERVVSWLTEELIALGHNVTLFASGDSVTRGTLVPILPRAIRLSRPRPDPFPAYAMQLDAIAEAAADFDIVHSHIDWVHLPVLNRLGIPHLTNPQPARYAGLARRHRPLSAGRADLDLRPPPIAPAFGELAGDHLPWDAQRRAGAEL